MTCTFFCKYRYACADPEEGDVTAGTTASSVGSGMTLVCGISFDSSAILLVMSLFQSLKM